MLPTISIIILNYNGKRHLEECFSTLSKTKYPKDLLDIIFVDNGSIDASVSYIRDNFPYVKVIENGANLGWAGGNNAGVREAIGEYIVFLNNDVRLDENWLLPLLAPFKSNSVGCVCSKIMLYDDPKVISGVGCFFTIFGISGAMGRGLPYQSYNRISKIFSPTGTSCMMRKDYYLKIGMFDSDFFLYCEDYDMGWRIINDGKFNVFSPNSLVYHKEHSGGLTSESSPGKELYYYYQSRNRILTIIKNCPFPFLLVMLPISLTASVIQGLLFLMKGYFNLAQSTFRGTMDSIFSLDFLKWWSKRKLSKKSFKFQDYTLGFSGTIKLLLSKKREHLDD